MHRLVTGSSGCGKSRLVASRATKRSAFSGRLVWQSSSRLRFFRSLLAARVRTIDAAPAMSFYADQILPRLLDFACGRKDISRVRARVAQGLRGEVLEIGFGSGLNLPHMPAAVTALHAVDPSATGKRLARSRLAASRIPIAWSGLDGQNLTLPDASVDCGLSTFTLCTVPDLDRTLREMRRVLRPGGIFHFLEHGRSPDAGVVRFQDMLTPLNRRLVGGCELNRPIAESLRAAGFCIDSLENYYLRGPKFSAYMYEGRARACAHGPEEECGGTAQGGSGLT